MVTTNILKTALQGASFLMVTGALMLFAADGKVFLSQPIGVAFFILWIIWWVMTFSMRSQRFFPDNPRAVVMHGFLYIGIVLAIGVGAPWEYIHFFQPFPRDSLMAWLGVIVSILSIHLLVLSMWTAGNLYGIRKNLTSDAYLITSGPYRYVRHPGYLSGVLFLMGIALALSSLIAWAAFGIATAFVIFRIRKDEQKLEEDYCEDIRKLKVRPHWRLLPGIF